MGEYKVCTKPQKKVYDSGHESSHTQRIKSWEGQVIAKVWEFGSSPIAGAERPLKAKQAAEHPPRTGQ